MVTPASPCIRHCTLDNQDICIGCGRSLEEILQWSAADDRRKRQILQRIAERKQAPLVMLLAAEQEGLDTGENNLRGHRRQDQTGDFTEDV